MSLKTDLSDEDSDIADEMRTNGFIVCPCGKRIYPDSLAKCSSCDTLEWCLDCLQVCKSEKECKYKQICDACLYHSGAPECCKCTLMATKDSSSGLIECLDCNSQMCQICLTNVFCNDCAPKNRCEICKLVTCTDCRFRGTDCGFNVRRFCNCCAVPAKELIKQEQLVRKQVTEQRKETLRGASNTEQSRVKRNKQ